MNNEAFAYVYIALSALNILDFFYVLIGKGILDVVYKNNIQNMSSIFKILVLHLLYYLLATESCYMKKN